MANDLVKVQDFIQNVGMDAANTSGVRKVRTVDFSFQRPSTAGDGKGIGMEKVNLSVPLLSIVKIPALSVDDVNVTFDMEVKSSVSSESSADEKVEAEAKAGFFGASVSIKGSVSAHQSNTRKSDNSAKYHVEVHAKDSGMPEGLAKVLDILSTASAPAKIEAVGNDGKTEKQSKPEDNKKT